MLLVASSAEDFAQICKAQMVEQGMSAEALAALIDNPKAEAQGVAKQTLLKWLSGQADMKASTMKRIADALGFELQLTLKPNS